ncbi:MAG: hypothetical protein Q4A66_10885, partial [Eubacteriales bacterium]|nr:hypothetical protein [Eubacteriales bacterium]
SGHHTMCYLCERFYCLTPGEKHGTNEGECSYEPNRDCLFCGEYDPYQRHYEEACGEHCSRQEGEHSRCYYCRGWQCDGRDHGSGVCNKHSPNPDMASNESWVEAEMDHQTNSGESYMAEYHCPICEKLAVKVQGSTSTSENSHEFIQNDTSSGYKVKLYPCGVHCALSNGGISDKENHAKCMKCGYFCCDTKYHIH